MNTLLARMARTQKTGILAILAILAAFAVYAAIGQKAGPASADVSGGNAELTGNCPDGQSAGDFCFYEARIELTDPTSGSLIMTVIVYDEFGNIQMTDDAPLGAEDAVCVVSDDGGTNNKMVCTWPGPHGDGASTSLFFAVEILDQCGDCDVFDEFLLEDGGSNQDPRDGVNHTSDSEFYSAEYDDFSKDADDTTDRNAGEIVEYTIRLRVDDDELDSDMTDLVIEDEFDSDWFDEIVDWDGNDGDEELDCNVSGLTITCWPNSDGDDGHLSRGSDVVLVVNVRLRSLAALVADGFLEYGDTSDEPVGNTATATWNTQYGRPCVNGNDIPEPCVEVVTASAEATASADEDIYVNNPAVPDSRPDLCAGIFHVDPWGNLLVGPKVGGCYTAAPRDVSNNVIGAPHHACVVDNGEFDRALGNQGELAVQPPNTTLIRWRIDTVSGASNVQGQATDQRDVGPFEDDINGDERTKYGNAEDLHCVRWYSTSPGEQNVTIVDELGRVVADWADGGSGANADVADVEHNNQEPNTTPDDFISTYTPLVKEWNVLEPTIITGSRPSENADRSLKTPLPANLDGTVNTVQASFDPASGTLKAKATGYENVLASHSNSAGSYIYQGIGALVDIKFTGCGIALISALDAIVVTDPADDFVLFPGETATYETVGRAIQFWVFTSSEAASSWLASGGASLYGFGLGDGHTFDGAVDCKTSGSGSELSFQAYYQNYLGSGTPPKPALEKIGWRWVIQPAQKQVFLAWAGQRIILEHDWRIPAGDQPDGTNNGECPFQSYEEEGSDFVWLAQYVKGGGPGNFIGGLGAYIEDPDQAYVWLDQGSDVFGDNTDPESQINDAPGRPQGACITRVLYESEQPGQVDIELFSGFVGAPDDYDLDNFLEYILRGNYTADQTKVAFVVYYMKLNTVTTSLVTQVSKPSHNGSIVADYSPGNPWDASKDDADNAADWNVSKDILVRIRVTGWFINENPSGRAADTTNPLNVLPANRWIMPDDWALLAGGPADPADGTDARGTAEEFRPYYDMMIAPNNASGIALVSPTGASVILAAVVVASASNSTSAFLVSSLVNLPVGASVTIGAGTTVYTVTSADAVSGFISISSALAAVPAAGTAIFVVNSTPFEGPFSLVDLPGLCALGACGAALSNFAGTTNSFVRDTILRDGDVDKYDAPMPEALISVKLRGAGFLKQVWKEDVYYNGTANSTAQVYPNPYYYSNIPGSPYIPAVVAGGGYLWDSWGDDGPAARGGLGSDLQQATAGLKGQGPYHFWQFVRINANAEGLGEAQTAAQRAELQAIRDANGDQSITRDAVVYTDNHGEAMVTANGDFNTDLTACASNILGGGKHCKPGDVVGKGTITATADYPDFRGKHFPVQSNSAVVTWTWGGYKDVTIEAGEDPQYKYVVFHAMDRDGFCYPPTGATLLHSVLSSVDKLTTIGSVDPVETVDFLIDSGQGIILNLSSSAGKINSDGNRQFATGLETYSLLINNPAVTGIKEFPVSSLATAGATDECQAWIRVSNSLLGIVNVLVFAKDDEGTIGFDRVIDLQNTAKLTLNFRWSLVTWSGANDIKVSDALAGTGANDAGNDISAEVTAVYGWDAAAQDWLGYFPAGVSVPGANDLTGLKKGSAYWMAIKGPASVEWTIATNVG